MKIVHKLLIACLINYTYYTVLVGVTYSCPTVGDFVAESDSIIIVLITRASVLLLTSLKSQVMVPTKLSTTI